MDIRSISGWILWRIDLKENGNIPADINMLNNITNETWVFVKKRKIKEARLLKNILKRLGSVEYIPKKVPRSIILLYGSPEIRRRQQEENKHYMKV
jgi:hypothetical protein